MGERAGDAGGVSTRAADGVEWEVGCGEKEDKTSAFSNNPSYVIK
jgi:hypothetical protein